MLQSPFKETDASPFKSMQSESPGLVKETNQVSDKNGSRNQVVDLSVFFPLRFLVSFGKDT